MKESVYDLYGIRCCSLERAKAVVEESLQLQLQPHESGYHCGDYFRLGDVGVEHFVLQKNFDELEAEWTDPEHKSYPFLLYVNETERADEIALSMEGRDEVELLKRQRL